MKAKRILLCTVLALTGWLAGCGVHIVNTTPERVPASPTGTLTLSAQARVKQQTVVPSSLDAFVVIDGEHYPMVMDPAIFGRFEYEYQVPAGSELTRFYYILNYLTQKKDAAPLAQQRLSDLYQVRLANPSTLTMYQTRAAIGTRVTITGEQFSREDLICVNQTICETIFISPQQLQFVVPELKPGFGYPIEVRGTTHAQHAGYLRIDPASPLSILPSSLHLQRGQQQALAFVLDYPAPYQGLEIRMTTDIPDSIQLPEIVIPAGARTVSSTIKAEKAGSGHLFIHANGLPERVVPVTIR